MADADLVQVAERALADAEEAYRLDPSDANQRRVMSAWAFVGRARQSAEAEGRSAEAAPEAVVEAHRNHRLGSAG